MTCYHATVILTVIAEDRQDAMDIVWERLQLTQVADGKGVVGAEFLHKTLTEAKRPGPKEKVA